MLSEEARRPQIFLGAIFLKNYFGVAFPNLVD